MKTIKQLLFANKFYAGLLVVYFAIQIRMRYLNTTYNLAYWGTISNVISYFSIIVWSLIILRAIFLFVKFLYKDSLKDHPNHKVLSILTIIASPFIFIAFLYYIVLSVSFQDEIIEEVFTFKNNVYVSIQKSGLLQCSINLYEYQDSNFRAYLPSYSSQIDYGCINREQLLPFEESAYFRSAFFEKHKPKEHNPSIQ